MLQSVTKQSQLQQVKRPLLTVNTVQAASVRPTNGQMCLLFQRGSTQEIHCVFYPICFSEALAAFCGKFIANFT